MRLVHIHYWAGKAKKDAVVLPVKNDSEGNLVCLKSDKLLNTDIAKLRSNSRQITKMDGDEFEQWVNVHLSSCRLALTVMKKGRYEIVQEFPIDG